MTNTSQCFGKYKIELIYSGICIDCIDMCVCIYIKYI